MPRRNLWGRERLERDREDGDGFGGRSSVGSDDDYGVRSIRKIVLHALERVDSEHEKQRVKQQRERAQRGDESTEG